MGSVDKAKPPVRVGRKATGLAGEAPELPRFAIRVFLDGRVAERMVTRLFHWCGKNRRHNPVYRDSRTRGGVTMGKWIVVFLFLIIAQPSAFALEYKMTVRTETGTYRVYKASWREAQQLAEREMPYPGMVCVSFAKVPKSPAALGTVIYTEDAIEVLWVKTFGRFLPKRWLHPLYKEIHNITSYRNLRKAAERDRKAYEQLKRIGRARSHGVKSFPE